MMYLMCIQVYRILHDVPRSYYFHDFQEVPKLFFILLKAHTRCLKIEEKVELDIASEASYDYILSGQVH